jgi:hypothetical protein
MLLAAITASQISGCVFCYSFKLYKALVQPSGNSDPILPLSFSAYFTRFSVKYLDILPQNPQNRQKNPTEFWGRYSRQAALGFQKGDNLYQKINKKKERR